MDSAATVQTNDYLWLAGSIGLPALILLINHIVNRLNIVSSAKHNMRCRNVAAACAIVFILGFWFDGALFQFSLAILFWTLLELQGIENHKGSAGNKIDVHPWPLHRGKSRQNTL